MRRGGHLAAGLGLLAVVVATGVHAQDRSILPRSSVVVVDQERLFSETVFGLRLSEELEAASIALAEENRRIEQFLIEEERALTEQRPDMAPEAFREAANAFDQQVNELRSEQDRKARIIAERSEAERRAFLDAALPILGGLMADYGAYVILDQRQIFLSDDRVNVTDEAIARIDAVLGERLLGTAPQPGSPEPSDPPQAPDTAPASPSITEPEN